MTRGIICEGGEVPTFVTVCNISQSPHIISEGKSIACTCASLCSEQVCSLQDAHIFNYNPYNNYFSDNTNSDSVFSFSLTVLDIPPLEPMTDDEQSNLAELLWQSPEVQALN